MARGRLPALGLLRCVRKSWLWGSLSQSCTHTSDSRLPPTPLHSLTLRTTTGRRCSWSPADVWGMVAEVGGGPEEHKRLHPQLSAFNYNYPLLIPFWLMRGGIRVFFLPFLPHFPRIEGWSEFRVLLPSSPSPWLLGERQTREGGDSVKRFAGTKGGQVWIAGHVPELERPPPCHWHPSHQSPSPQTRSSMSSSR